MIIIVIKSEKHTLGRKYRLECTKLTRFKKDLQATLACRTSQPVVIYLNCPAATAACLLAKRESCWVQDTPVGRVMEGGRITGNGWRTEWKSEKDLRLDQQVEMEDNKVEVEEEAGEGVATERLMTVKAEVTMVDTDSLGR